jgi:hypothetical protein
MRLDHKMEPAHRLVGCYYEQGRKLLPEQIMEAALSNHERI